MDNIYIIIPSFNPDESIMREFITDLYQACQNIVIVNDGSDASHDLFFKSFEHMGIPVLKHVVNQGKGRAIKSGFNYVLNHHDFDAVVTADCDGQHAVKDIQTCGRLAQQHPHDLVLGVRDFSQDDVPKKSRFGNRITIQVFKIFIGLNITDTQTGLRAFSQKVAKEFLGVAGERYDYETNMLISCKEKDIKISETRIDTIYINKNQTSHFNPIKDSFIIYKLFFKYILVALSSFILDISLFQLFMWMLSMDRKIFYATIFARVFSSMFNYKLNGKLIFKHSSIKSMIKYYLLVLGIMLISGFMVTFICEILTIKPVLVKLVVDGLLFVLSFVVQREWVFKR
ncbi:hypothetical protein AOC36_03145 [Erysipelothrix larvae]|uniref:Uncharacterized protein n=1 Tax=Erysipelothrix larvae TaxID=1514105 RepID=A0A109UGP5_9FIRM|nr:bifunctional glycosyltransferase family 2/GtrA family protein [Erysipelothrix larvae]AMC93013.1 hypothetical protein AOC36_03145 [Erysipelothrix larvae]